jgi:sugar lactone lactonase YvrE
MLSNTRAVGPSNAAGMLTFGEEAVVPVSMGSILARRGASRGVALCVALLVAAGCALWASAARAERSVKYVESGVVATAGEGESEVSSPQHLLVDQAHHTLVVADFGHSRLAIYSLAGGTPTFQQAVGVGLQSAPYGVAIDESSKYLYVSDAGNNRILRYSYTSGSPATYTLDNSFPSPTQGTKLGQIGNFVAALAVDPTTHDLLVADRGNHVIDRYSSTGTLLNAYNGSSTGTIFSGPTDVAVGADGTTYVMDLAGFVNFQGVSRLERFNTADEWIGGLSPATVSSTVALNQTDGTVYAGGFEESFSTAEISGLVGEELVGASHDPVRSVVISGLTADDSSNGKIYASTNENGVRGYTITPLSHAATVTIAAPSATTSSIHVSGTVDAGNAAETAQTTARLEYSTDQVTWTPSTELPLTGSGPQTVQGDITGLAPRTQYYVRIVTTGDFVTDSEAEAITTGDSPPAVETLNVNNRSATSAVLDGQINPNGLLTTYHFEYGSSTAYDQRVPVSGEELANRGHAGVPVYATLSGLTPASTFHYRIVAQNADGVSYGPDATFTTPGSGEGPPARAFEMVTPVDKHGALVDRSSFAVASADGNALGYNGRNSADLPESKSSPVEVRYSARRGADGWTLYAGDVPELAAEVYFNITFIVGTSPDLTHEVVASAEKLAPGATEGIGNFYLYDVVTGEYQFISSLPFPQFGEITENSGGTSYVQGGNSDFSRVILQLESGTEEFSDGKLTPVTILPDGSRAELQPSVGVIVSEDATHVAFGSPVYGNQTLGAYVRAGGHTIAMSVSHRPGDDPTIVQPAIVVGGSGDGRYYFFYALPGAPPLTSDAPAGGDLYRYDYQTGALIYVGNHGAERFSKDGNAVLINSFGEAGYAAGFHLWREGHEMLVTGPGAEAARLSPNGRYVLFSTTMKLTSFNNENTAACGGDCPEGYLFDADTETVTCMTCPANHSLSTGSWSPDPPNDQGTVFFDTPTPLVPADTNGTTDVYEYHAGEVHLISPGTRPDLARLVAVSPSGSDVFFTTEQQLVAQDTDTEFDIYDARIGGGIPSQTQDRTPSPECGAGQCPASLGAGASTSASVASVNVAQANATAARSTAAKLKVTKKAVKGAALTLSIEVPGKGSIVGSGAGLARVTKAVAKVGTYSLRLALTASEKRKLTRAGKLTVVAHVSYQPDSGPASSTVVSVVFAKKKTNAKRAARTGGRAGR